MTKLKYLWPVLLLVILLGASYLIADNGRPFRALVTGVIDGDTIVIQGDLRVRYIGVDTPEIENPAYGRKGEPLGQEAKDINQRMVLGKVITLRFDSERRDRYGRLLAYVWADSTFVNAELVRAGLARVIHRPPNLRYFPLLKKLEREARDKRSGIWGGHSRPKPAHKPR
jgi:micrococcal nuclease